MDIIKNIKIFFSKKNISPYMILYAAIFFIGFIIRLKLFMYNPSMFRDEANLALNMIQTDKYTDFFFPLQRLQVAPPMFLILSKFIYSFKSGGQITPFESDMMLRVIPFIFGVLSIPFFGMLVHKIFKNNFTTAVGMAIITFFPLLITFSVNYKQYSLEAFITTVILLITLDINFNKTPLFKNICKFILLGCTSYFSLTAVMILPASMLYLFIQAKKQKCLKNYFYCLLFFIVSFAAYYFTFLQHILSAHYKPMVKYWVVKQQTTKIYYWLGLSFFALLFSKNSEYKILFSLPILITLLAILTNNYPLIDRLIIFIIPVMVICLLNIIEYILKNKFKDFENYYILVLSLSVCCLYLYMPPISKYRFRMEYGREIWERLMIGNQTDATILLGKSSNTNKYYGYFYQHLLSKQIMSFDLAKWDILPAGRYIYIVTAHKKSVQEKNFLLKQPDVEIKNHIFVSKHSYYIEFFKKSNPKEIIDK